jgi:hypothetical protein
LTDAIWLKTKVSRETTKGIDFDDVKKRGATVLDKDGNPEK